MPPAARVTDMHKCPKTTNRRPHVGGPILPTGVPSVVIGFKPAAVIGTACQCNGPPDQVSGGSATVRIGGRPAARQGDPTAHGGVIIEGCPTVIIG